MIMAFTLPMLACIAIRRANKCLCTIVRSCLKPEPTLSSPLAETGERKLPDSSLNPIHTYNFFLLPSATVARGKSKAKHDQLQYKNYNYYLLCSLFCLQAVNEGG